MQKFIPIPNERYMKGYGGAFIFFPMLLAALERFPCTTKERLFQGIDIASVVGTRTAEWVIPKDLLSGDEAKFATADEHLLTSEFMVPVSTPDRTEATLNGIIAFTNIGHGWGPKFIQLKLDDRGVTVNFRPDEGLDGRVTYDVESIVPVMPEGAKA